MLVYANTFSLEPAGGRDQVIQCMAAWVGKRAKSYVDPEKLSQGIRELKLPEGKSLSSMNTNDDGVTQYPYLFSAILVHPDDRVSGRRWVTEVGVRQINQLAPVECSVILRTDEVSPKVNTPIQVTCPILVRQLLDTCKPIQSTPGLKIKTLDEESAPAFIHEIERLDRAHPIVLISPSKNGVYPIEPERLRSVLVGLADVVDVPLGVDTFAVEAIVGRRNIAFGGAINIVFPARRGNSDIFNENLLFHPGQIADLREEQRNVDSEVLAAIVHRTNLPTSWRHISPEMVGQARLRVQLTRKIEQSKASGNANELAEFTALLEEADKELKTKDEDIRKLRADFEDKSNEVLKLQSDNDSLKYALSGAQNSDGLQNTNVLEALIPLRNSISGVLKGDNGLYQALQLISSLYAERITVLESAFDSARESDKGGFKNSQKAYEILCKLASEYWQALAEGLGDQQAKNVFGQNGYAQNEGSALSTEGKRRRTFSYRDRDFTMEKHLKHGHKDSRAETLRVHFEWLSAERKILVGHCGKHLDF
jgi:hypothetical protein